jgi:hypothetical protein
MTKKRFPWVWSLVAIAIGFGLGLAYAWVIRPVRYVDAEPSALREDFKDHYRSAIAAAYAANADLERAHARLTLLGDTDPSQALAAQAQRMLAGGESSTSIQQVAMLAAALKGQVASEFPTATLAITIPTGTSEPTSQSQLISTATHATGTIIPTTIIEPTETSIPLVTSTSRPTRTPTPTLGAPYQLVGQDTICDPELAEGLLQVVVRDTARQPIPGAGIIVTWNSGEEHIFTGFKPELGFGYADYLMAPNVIYSIRMADGGTSATELSAPACTDTNGASYRGGLLVTFQKP